MRVAFFSHYAELYGANRSLLNLIDGLKQFSVEPLVVVPCTGPFTEKLQQRGVPFEIIKLKWWMAETKEGRWRRARENVRCLGPIRDCLKKFGAQVVYTNSTVIPLGATAAFASGLPHIWHFREFGDLDYNLRLDWGKFLSGVLFNRSDAFVVISNILREHLKSRVAKRPVYTIYNGVANEREFDDLRDRARKQERKPGIYTFALVGLLTPAKGTETAIRGLAEALKTQPQCRLVLAGKGVPEYETQCRNICEELRVGNEITFLGQVSDPFSVYLQADAVLMCSPNEAMGRVTVEAMAACRPVIGLARGATPELIQHCQTGLLYQGGAKELGACMAQLAADPASATTLAENAWQYARANFTTEVYAAKIFDVIKSVQQRRGSL